MIELAGYRGLSPEVQEQARLKLRAQVEASTFVMASVLGFRDITPSLHLEMCRWVDNGSIRKLGLVPRDHLKTSLWTIANSVKRIVCDPNIRILLANETATNASHFLRRIQAVFEKNTTFQWLFPELIPNWTDKPKWSETEMLIPRSDDYPESTIEVIGCGGAVVSRHYTLIKLDDLVGKEASESAEVMRKTIDWYQLAESLLVAPYNEIQVFGTRWGWADMYSWMEKHEGDILDKFHRGVYDPTSGEPIWPERFSRESLERIRRKIFAFKFSCQYLNSPNDPDGGSFREEWLHYYHLQGDDIRTPNGTLIPTSTLRKFMRVDPAISERSGSARSAIVVDGVHSDNRIFLLDTWAKRCQPFDMIEAIFDLQERWECEAVGIESVAYQRILKPVIEAEAERRGTWLNVICLTPDSRERKENRIRGALQPYLQRGLYWVRQEFTEWLEEYSLFPNGTTIDLMDATAYGPPLWDSPPSDEDEAEFERQEDMFAQQMGGRCAVTGY